MAEGIIKKIIHNKGFGFIAGDNGELFFHNSSIEYSHFDDLREGQRVEYTEGNGPKGPRAENIKVL